MRHGRQRVLFVSVYPESNAGVRLRCTQFVPAIEAAGLTCSRWSFFSEAAAQRWLHGSVPLRMAALLVGLIRLAALPVVARHPAVIVLHREASPLGPPVVELWMAKRRPLVWDVDDAVWTDHPGLFMRSVPRWLRKPTRKYERICERAAETWAGSEVLAASCRQHSQRVVVIPTVVDVPVHPSARRARRLGWIGSPTTARFLEQILPALDTIAPTVSLRAVGAKPSGEVPAWTSWAPWSYQNEESALESTSIGLYPVDTSHPLAEGKCGLKAILYLSRGIPVVLTPTTTNASIVKDEIHGLYARTPEQWVSGVQRLLDDPGLWERLSKRGHSHVRANYSLERWAPTVVGRLAGIIAPARGGNVTPAGPA